MHNLKPDCEVTGHAMWCAQPVAECLVKEVAKPRKDSMTEVVRSGDFLSYTAEEGVRFLGEGNLLASDSFPGQDRTKLALVQKVWAAAGYPSWLLETSSVLHSFCSGFVSRSACANLTPAAVDGHMNGTNNADQ